MQPRAGFCFEEDDMSYYIMSEGMLIEQYQSCPTEDDLKELAEECGLDDMWVIDGEHSGITWTRPDPSVLPHSSDHRRMICA
jgi:hypothetical protein